MSTPSHSIGQSVWLHLYPGLLITLFFVLVTPTVVAHGYPPQFSMLLAVCCVALPVLGWHLFVVRQAETNRVVFTAQRQPMRWYQYLIIVSSLVIWAFALWGLTMPLSGWLSGKAFAWLPTWYTTQVFAGYSRQAIMATLVLNIAANGILAPVAEELYFRGYLLPRISYLGRYAPVLNTILFAVYHFWQPYLYPTLILALLPMVYIVWQKQNLRLGIYTHCLLNLIGATVAFLQLPY